MSPLATPQGKWDPSGTTKIPVVMVRLNLKLLLVILSLSVGLVTVSLWSRCGELAAVRGLVTDKGRGGVAAAVSSDLQGYEEIDCSINGEYSVGCRKEGGEIYLPFSFVRKYFDVYGKMATYDGYERFEWSHSYSKVYYPKGRYDPRGVYMYFENYNVEVRERVKCVSGVAGVPVSTQWESQGYFYPTQVAQFGLSHYSKNLTEPEPRRRLLEDGDKETARWTVPGGGALSRTFDEDADSHVLAFDSPETLATGVTLKLDHVLDFVLSVDVRLEGNASFTVTLQSREKRETFFLHYVASDLLVSAQDAHTYHGIGAAAGGYRRITRDLVVDLQKGLLFQNRKRKLSRSKIKVVGVTFRGRGRLDNLTLSSSEHLAQFYDAAAWFVERQDPVTGGWPNPVRRHVVHGMQDLQPGWYSAMGQGHAISVLARAYHHSNGETRYLDAALAGLKPFKISSQAGGVKAMFADKIVWYEEYPTRPSSFVLNGFVFALLGLYDLKTIAPPERATTAAALFDAGMASLKRLLTLYDTGSGTVYDLRHFTLGTAPNLARWDYHATHVNQLLLLATIDRDPLLSTTAERWIGYMNGKRAAHN